MLVSCCGGRQSLARAKHKGGREMTKLFDLVHGVVDEQDYNDGTQNDHPI